MLRKSEEKQSAFISDLIVIASGQNVLILRARKAGCGADC
jgi:hypothetical protein